MEENSWGDEDDLLLPPPPDADDLAELEPEPEPEPPDIAEATARCSSDADLAACLRVLRALKDEDQVFLHSRRFREVRSSVMQLSKTMQEKMYDGKSAAEYIEWSVKAQIERAAKDRLRRRDAEKLEKTQLRAARLQRLAELQDKQSSDGLLALSAVPDGAVQTDEMSGTSAAILAAGVGAQSSFAVKAGRRTLPAAELVEKLSSGSEEAERVSDQAASAAAEKEEELHQERRCYQCKSWYKKLHHFYAQLCPECAGLNWIKRHQTADMGGRVALVTGGRVKIGYHVALKLLRCGATTIVTSRFPADAARRFAAEPDFEQWGERLHCYGLDLRHIEGVESFCAHLNEKFSRLDVLINNACQTIRRPAAYYQHMLAGEKEAASPKEAETLRPLLANHVAWTSHSSGRAAQVEAPRAHGQSQRHETASKPSILVDADEASSVAEHSRRGQGQAEANLSVIHDSVRMSQLAVHTEDAVVTVGPRIAEGHGDLCSGASNACTNANVSSLSKVNVDSGVDGRQGQVQAATESERALAILGGQGSEVVLPENVYDVNGQQLDTRRENSWLLKLGEIETVEAAEVFAINALAPFALNSKLKPLLLAGRCHRDQEAEGSSSDTQGRAEDREDVDEADPRFIVNVSAMEGKFYRYKTPNHPHTNMAKAALNMMTRTSAGSFKDEGIYMNSVDTGWINDENPLEKASRLAKEGFQTPIDEIDAAARILDPVMLGLRQPSSSRSASSVTRPQDDAVNGIGNEVTGAACDEQLKSAAAQVLHYGAFFKDYKLTEW